MEYREPSDIEIYKRDQGVVLRNNSMIAIDQQGEGHILAIGKEAQYIQNPEAKIYTPIKDGRIAEWNDSCKLIRWYLSQVWKPRPFKRLRIAVCILPGYTGIERTAMEEAMYLAGARKVLLTELSREEFLREPESQEYDFIISIGRNFRV